MKKTVILLGIFLALLAFVYFYEYKGGLTREKAREEASSLLKMDEDDVESVTLIRAGGDTLAYVRGDQGAWRIVSPVATPADESSIRASISAFTHATIKRRWTASTGTLGDYGLNPPDAEVHVRARDGTERRLLVGSETASRGDIFASLGDGQGKDSTEIVVTASTVRVQATKSLFDLRDKKIAHFDDGRVIKVDLNSDEGNIILEKSDGEWTMVAPRDLRVDDSRVTGYLRSLKNYSAKAFVSERWEDEALFGFNAPAIRIKLTLGEERSTKEIVVGKLVEEEKAYYAHESGRSPVFLIRESTFKAMTKTPFYFEERKLVHVEKEKTSEIRFSGAYRWTLVREDTLGWYAHGDTSLKIEGSRMDRLFSNLRSFRVTDLVTYDPGDLASYGLSVPFLEVVLIDTTGEQSGFEIGDPFDDDRYVKRRDFPFVYSVPVSQVERITRWLEELAGEES